MKTRILTDRLSRMFEYLLKVKNTLKKLTVKFFQSVADEERQSILKSSSAGKKTVLVFEPQAVQDGTVTPFPHAIIHFPEKNETKKVEKSKSNIAKEEMKSHMIHIFPDFNILKKNKTVGLWEKKLNISEYKAKMQKPFGLPIKNYFPNFKNVPDTNKILGSVKSSLSPVKSTLGRNRLINVGNETENSFVRSEYNPEDIRLLVEGFRTRLPLFSEKDKKKQRNSTSRPRWLDLESDILQNWMDTCLEISKTAIPEEEEEIEPEMYISYNKKDFSKTFFSHPSLFPFAAVVRIFKLILQNLTAVAETQDYHPKRDDDMKK
ncbi:hypothetical protein HNY73_003376 [Argiope bruennichi]|uniref:Uncharacterized protein n=1 Tax=Argiope bruennichi TaxID=94029 RepID=A0A8T0FKY7_ARGBR|nr:hypothetical protein HNY73_003376 [Argiope bruennichi]